MRTALWVLVTCASVLPAADVFSDFPLQVGNTWTYEHEDLSGDRVHPDVSSWTTVTTVRGSLAIPEGTIILRDTRLVEGRPNGGWIAGHGSFHYLLRQNCLYFLDQSEWDEASQALREDFRAELLSRGIAPDICFPLEAGKQWRGNADECRHWSVQGLGGGQLRFIPGSIEARDFHMVFPPMCSGDTGHMWFRNGTGITGEWYWHNGTYSELRVRLIKFQATAK